MAEQIRPVAAGDMVKFHDANGREYNALVTIAWTLYCLNIVVVSKDETRTDSYGRQIERYTSLLHKSQQPAHGMYWRFADETPNPMIAPQSI